MSIRLLAYGGTGYRERRRIGRWPDMDPGILGSDLGVAHGVWSFGVTVVESSPAIILRTRQNIDNRGGYAFSVLLDPGEQAWKRFDWNAASLCSEVLSSEWGERALLLDRPDELTEDALTSAIERFQFTRSDVAGTASVSRMQALIVAAVKGAELELTLADLDLDTLPSPKWMSGVLDGLDPAFRVGNGWIVGSPLKHAEALGANLAVNGALRDGKGSIIETRLTDGNRCLSAWRNNIDLLGNLRNLRVDLWPGPGKDILERVVFLGELRNYGAADEPILERAKSGVSEVPELENEIDKILDEMILTTPGELGELATARRFDLAMGGIAPMNEKDVLRSSWLVMRGKLASHKVPPSEPPACISLPREKLASLWVDYLMGQTVERPRALRQAISQLGYITDDTATDLIRKVTTDLEAARGSLREWDVLREIPAIWEVFEPVARKLCISRLNKNLPSSPEEFLYLANDPGAKQSALELTPSAAESLVRGIQTQNNKEAERWLEEIPVSPLRQLLTLKFKEELMRSRPGEWQSLYLLFEAFRKRIPKGFVKISRSERPFCLSELDQLLAHSTAAPDVQLIRKALGDLPPDIEAKLCAREIQTHAKAETLPAAPNPSEKLPQTNGLSLNPQELSEIAETLKMAIQDPVVQGADEMGQIHRLWETYRTRLKFSGQFDPIFSGRTDTAPFAHRFKSETTSLAHVMAFYSPKIREEMIEAIKQHLGEAPFQNKTAKDISTALRALGENGKNEGTLNEYHVALASYLLKNKKLAENIAGRRGGESHTALEKKLKKLIAKEEK